VTRRGYNNRTSCLHSWIDEKEGTAGKVAKKEKGRKEMRET